MARAVASTGPVIGFIGTGTVETEQMATLIEEFLDAREGDPRFLIPVTDTHFTDDLAAIIDLANEGDVAYETVSLPVKIVPRAYAKYVNAATKSHKVEDPGAFIVQQLAKAANGALFYLWPSDGGEEDEETGRVINLALEAGVRVFELTDGLTEVEPEEGDEGAPPADEPEEEETEAEEAEEEDPGTEEEEEETEAEEEEAEEEEAEEEEGLEAAIIETLEPIFAEAMEKAVAAILALSAEEEPEPEPPARRGRRK